MLCNDNLHRDATHTCISVADALPHVPTCGQPDAAQLLFPLTQWRVQESHLQGELSQATRDRDEAQKQCADLQRRHAQAQHEIRRKVHHALLMHLEARYIISYSRHFRLCTFV